jgi:hypothetical protein
MESEAAEARRVSIAAALRAEMQTASNDDLRRFELIADRHECADLAAMVSAERAHRRDEERDDG